MNTLRKLFLIGGAAILLSGIFFWWRNQPPSTPEQQIIAALDNAENAIESRSLSSVMQHLTRDFQWNTTSRSEVADILRGAFFQARDVQISRAAEGINVNGQTATSTGIYRATYRTSRRGPPTTSEGRFTLHWRLEDGQWKIFKAEGQASGLASGI